MYKKRKFPKFLKVASALIVASSILVVVPTIVTSCSSSQSTSNTNPPPATFNWEQYIKSDAFAKNNYQPPANTKVLTKELVKEFGWDKKAWIGSGSEQEQEILSGFEWIGDNAFSDCDKLVEIIFPTTIRGIGKEAFYRPNLINDGTANNNTIQIYNRIPGDFSARPDSILYYGKRSFFNTDNGYLEISSVPLNNLSRNAIFIDDEAFGLSYPLWNGGGNKPIKFPQSLWYVGKEAFSYGRIPDNTSYFMQLDFFECVNLKWIADSAFLHGNIAKVILPQHLSSEQVNFAYILPTGLSTSDQTSFLWLNAFAYNNIEELVLPQTFNVNNFSSNFSWLNTALPPRETAIQFSKFYPKLKSIIVSESERQHLEPLVADGYFGSCTITYR